MTSVVLVLAVAAEMMSAQSAFSVAMRSHQHPFSSIAMMIAQPPFFVKNMIWVVLTSTILSGNSVVAASVILSAQWQWGLNTSRFAAAAMSAECWEPALSITMRDHLAVVWLSMSIRSWPFSCLTVTLVLLYLQSIYQEMRDDSDSQSEVKNSLTLVHYLFTFPDLDPA